MRALMSVSPGGPETLELLEIEAPTPGPGEVLVRVRACSINYPDVLMIEDKYQVRPPRPFAPGCEIAGEVAVVGDGVGEWGIGDRVIAMIGFGGLSEYAVVPEYSLYCLPADRAFAEGASLVMTYATTFHALVDRGHLKPGETLLVLGASGGVGTAAIELGNALGARVVAAVSSPEKASLAKELGADAVIVYPRGDLDRHQQKDLSDTFKRECAGGPDVIFDPVGGAYSEPALRAIAWGGRYLVVGFPAGIPRPPLNLALLKSCDICGVFWGEFADRDRRANHQNMISVYALWEEGKIAPHVTETYALENGGAAIAKLGSRGAMGKIVVTVD